MFCRLKNHFAYLAPFADNIYTLVRTSHTHTLERVVLFLGIGLGSHGHRYRGDGLVEFLRAGVDYRAVSIM